RKSASASSPLAAVSTRYWRWKRGRKLSSTSGSSSTISSGCRLAAIHNPPSRPLRPAWPGLCLGPRGRSTSIPPISSAGGSRDEFAQPSHLVLESGQAGLQAAEFGNQLLTLFGETRQPVVFRRRLAHGGFQFFGLPGFLDKPEDVPVVDRADD